MTPDRLQEIHDRRAAQQMRKWPTASENGQLVDELLDAVRELTMLLARMRKAGKACNCPASVPLAIISLEIDAAIGLAGREVAGS
jgi:type VI protein secretion system component VasF